MDNADRCGLLEKASAEDADSNSSMAVTVTINVRTPIIRWRDRGYREKIIILYINNCVFFVFAVVLCFCLWFVACICICVARSIILMADAYGLLPRGDALIFAAE